MNRGLTRNTDESFLNYSSLLALTVIFTSRIYVHFSLFSSDAKDESRCLAEKRVNNQVPANE